MARGRSLPSVMKNHFAQMPNVKLRRSSFDRSHGYKTTFDMDYIIPIYWDDVLPGDTFTLSETHLCRLTTLVQPIMDNIRLTTQFFFVPSRLLWDKWEDFITTSDQPVAWTDQDPTNKLFVPRTTSPSTERKEFTNPPSGSKAAETPPTVDKGGYEQGSIYDYFGLPTKVSNYTHQVLPLRAYNLIFNEYYRDENLQNSLPVWTGDADPKVDPKTGLESTAADAVPYQYKLMRRNKRYDYFTSALPGLQKGPAVGIGISGGDNGRLPVHGLAINRGYDSLPNPDGSVALTESNVNEVGNGYGSKLWSSIDGTIESHAQAGVQGTYVSRGSTNVVWTGTPITQTSTAGQPFATTPPLNVSNWPIYVDLGSASSVTINSLRNAITLQHWFEKNARYGTRYVEAVQGHFGVHVGDYRAQRPVYLGGSKSYVSVNPVVQNSSTDNTSPQGNLAAYALSADTKTLFTKSFAEHGWIIGLVSATADLTYQQGLDRCWSRFSRYDYYWPTFAHLGEQPIYNKELYCQNDNVKSSDGVSVNDVPFGYQERYAEYRYKPSKITGLFRSNATGTLDCWHLSQKFDNLPTLNETFIQSNTPIDRALAVPNQPDFICDFYFSLRCIRPMPIYSVPGLRRI